MDLACLQGKDNVFSGRFVLVSYSGDDDFFPGGIILGFKNNRDDLQIYPNIECTTGTEFKFTQFEIVTSPIKQDWNKYYISDGYFYTQLPDESYFDNSGQVVYYKPKTEGNNLVGSGQIVQIYNNTTGEPSSIFYQCINEPTDTSSVAQWKLIRTLDDLILNGEEYSFYLKNYNLDKAHYKDSFDLRGYDATIWEKVYAKGYAKFVLVARLNSASFPAFELQNDPPSLMPTAPYLDTWKSDSLYKVHVPTHPGLQLKPATGKRDLLDNGDYGDWYYPTSDVERIESIIEDQDDYYPEIYLNLGGSRNLNAQKEYHLIESHKEKNKSIPLKNNIELTLTGESGAIYTDKNGAVGPQPDLLEVGIHLPIIGDIVDDFYDIVYGTTSEIDLTRPRDIEWYDGNVDDNLKQKGNGALNYKQYDLNTVAGTLNTMHSQLGQIIVTWENLPDTSNPYYLNAFDKNKIYYCKSEDKYYRIGVGYNYIDPAIKLEGNPYYYVEAEEVVDADSYITNTYYEDSLGRVIAMGEFDPSKTYYKKCLAPLAYEVIHAPDNNDPDYVIGLRNFEAGKYFLHSPTESNYYRDNNAEPSEPDRTYYYMDEPNLSSGNLITNDIEAILVSSFNNTYSPNTFYMIDEDENYIKALEDLPNPETVYCLPQFTPYQTPTNSEVVFYEPNLFYYKDDDGIFHLSEYETFLEGRVELARNGWFTTNDHGQRVYFYWLQFSEEPTLVSTVIDGRVHTELAYTLVAAHGIVNVVDENDRTNLYYYDDITQNYIAYVNIAKVGDGHNTPLWAIPRAYWKLVNNNPVTDLYIPGKYWMFDNNTTKNYITCDLTLSDLRSSGREYVFKIKKSWEVSEKFFIKDTYYYQSSLNHYEIDGNMTMTPNRKYYTKLRLYVDTDSSKRCPHGYEWNNYALFVPASIDLKMREEYPKLYEISNFTNDNFSINNYLLTLCNMLLEGDENTRDVKTLQGALNHYKDYMYSIGRLLPDKLLFVNSFGQIASSNIEYSKLLQIDWDRLLTNYRKT